MSISFKNLSVIALASALPLCYHHAVFAADDVCKYFGASLSCQAGVLDSLTNTGAVRLKGTIIEGDVTVTGSFKAVDTALQNVHITGSTEIGSSKVKGSAVITGTTKTHESHFNAPVQITGNWTSDHDEFADKVSVAGKVIVENSQFAAQIEAQSKEIAFSEVNAAGITIKSTGLESIKPSLTLRDNSVVTGPVIFEGGNGMVFIASGSRVDGQISGAEVFYAS